MTPKTVIIIIILIHICKRHNK